MKKERKAKLRRLGYRVVSTAKLLGLSQQETALIDLKIELIEKLKEIRRTNNVTQKHLAKLMKSSQSRVAMIEGRAEDVSLDLICKALFALGVTPKTLGKTIAP